MSPGALPGVEDFPRSGQMLLTEPLLLDLILGNGRTEPRTPQALPGSQSACLQLVQLVSKREGKKKKELEIRFIKGLLSVCKLQTLRFKFWGYWTPECLI